MELSSKCGSKDRHYRNTLIFLLPSPRGLTRLRNALREVAALESVKRDYASQLDEEQRVELKQKLEKARESVGDALGAAYTTAARVEGQRVAVVTLSQIKPTLADHLQAAWKQLVEEDEWILRKVGTVTLQNVGLVPTDAGIRLKDCLEAFLRYTDKPMVATKDAVLQGIAQACKDGIVGIGRGVNLAKIQTKSCGQVVDLDPNEDGLWVIPPFSAQPTTDATKVPTGQEAGGTLVHTGEHGLEPGVLTEEGGGTTTIGKPAEATGRKVRHVTIKGDVPMESWADVFRCFVSPAARLNPRRLRLGIDFDVELSAALNEDHPTLKAMREAARQFGLELDEE